MNFKNILIWRTGVEYVFPQGVSVRAAFGFDRYATPEEALDFRNIDVDKFTLLGGIGYRTGNMQICLRGTRAGTFLHGIFEHLDFADPDPRHLDQVAIEKFREFGFDLEWHAPRQVESSDPERRPTAGV